MGGPEVRYNVPFYIRLEAQKRCPPVPSGFNWLLDWPPSLRTIVRKLVQVPMLMNHTSTHQRWPNMGTSLRQKGEVETTFPAYLEAPRPGNAALTPLQDSENSHSAGCARTLGGPRIARTEKLACRGGFQAAGRTAWANSGGARPAGKTPSRTKGAPHTGHVQVLRGWMPCCAQNSYQLRLRFSGRGVCPKCSRAWANSARLLLAYNP
jgi:hypothetical protein